MIDQSCITSMTCNGCYQMHLYLQSCTDTSMYMRVYEGIDMSADVQPRPAGKLLYSIDEVAELTGHSRAYLYELMARGKLRFVLAGRRRLVRAEDLGAYVDSLTSERA
jgi:excisionase family DNA binding protein